jgi:uncharacterized OsmC-like protein
MAARSATGVPLFFWWARRRNLSCAGALARRPQVREGSSAHNHGLMTAPTPSPTLREYDIAARSTDIFGRVLASARNHHFIVDGPIQNDCPGEEITPGEMFLSAVASCGVELMHVIAKNEKLPLDRVVVKIHAWNDRTKQSRTDFNTFNSVRLDVTVWGANMAQATTLVDGFKARCPLFGTVAIAVPDVQVHVALGT